MTDPKTKFPEYNLTDGELRAEVSKDHTLDIASFIPWKAVGEYLPGIDDQDVEDMDVEGHDEQDKRRKLLGLWKTRNGSKATYGVLITALLKARRRNRAEEVCKLLRPGGKTQTNVISTQLLMMTFSLFLQDRFQLRLQPNPASEELVVRSYTVEPLNKGHLGTQAAVPYSEVVPYWEVCILTVLLQHHRCALE